MEETELCRALTQLHITLFVSSRNVNKCHNSRAQQTNKQEKNCERLFFRNRIELDSTKRKFRFTQNIHFWRDTPRTHSSQQKMDFYLSFYAVFYFSFYCSCFVANEENMCRESESQPTTYTIEFCD